MATIPIPPSYPTILGRMIESFRSKVGVRSLRVGNPLLNIMESAAQNDFRSTQDTFGLLQAIDLGSATGSALDKIGRSENLPRKEESPSSGFVTIRDSRYTKISSRLHQGSAAPITGSLSLKIADGGSFPATGRIYIGRETLNYEGPIPYTAIVQDGGSWTLTLGTATQKFHNVGESVVLAQGGDRTIPVGTTVQTPQGNATDAVQFTTSYSSTILDGEIEVDGVSVVSTRSGVIGNVAAGSVSGFASSPFAGATVENKLPFTNGQPSEDNETYRDRIRQHRQSRTLGTRLAIKLGVEGLTAPDENKRILSASVLTRQGEPTTLYIDDGTGYEERSEGVALETIETLADGGEQFFELANRPVAKAFIQTESTAPFEMVSGSILAVKVGGVVHEHTFDASSFRAIGNASAYDVISSINANTALGFAARSSDGNTRVAIYSKEDSNEGIEVVAPSELDSLNANEALIFSLGRRETLKLYRNDVLLYKDGLAAKVLSAPQPEWGTVAAGATLTISVDRTAPATYTFTDQDFIDHTPYAVLSEANSLKSWADVLNAKIPGITATVESGRLAIASNVGPNARGGISITGGTMVSANVFDLENSRASAKGYNLDRNTGQIKLVTPLNKGDKLTAGTSSTRAFLESPKLGFTTFGSVAKLWFAVDGSASSIKVGLTNASPVTFTKVGSPTWGSRVRVSSPGAFSNVMIGDWIIAYDPALHADNKGVFRVSSCTGDRVEFQADSAWAGSGTINLTMRGLVFARSSSLIQEVAIPAGANYSARDVAQRIDNALVGATASTYRTNQIRIHTNTYGLSGDIVLLAANPEATGLNLPVGVLVQNADSHTPSVESRNEEAGTPAQFRILKVESGGDTVIELDQTGTSPGSLLVGSRNFQETYGNNNKFVTPIAQIDHSAPPEYPLTLRKPGLLEWLKDDRLWDSSPYSIGPEDNLIKVINGDADSKRIVSQMYRRVKPTSNVYGRSNSFVDLDNAGASLTKAFGTGFSFDDYAAYMRARTISHRGTLAGVLWRYKRFGPEGHNCWISYSYPDAPESSVSVKVDGSKNEDARFYVSLPSGEAVATPNLRAATRMGVSVASGALIGVTYIFGFSITRAGREGSDVTLTLEIPSAGGVAGTGLEPGMKIYVKSEHPAIGSGLRTISGASTAAPFTVTYPDPGDDVVEIAVGGTISVDTMEAGLMGSSVNPGDLVHVSEKNVSLPVEHRGITGRISAMGPQFFTINLEDDGTLTPGLTPNWGGSNPHTVRDAKYLQFYPIDQEKNGTEAIAAAVNALPDCPISAVAVGDFSGSKGGMIDKASFEEAGLYNAGYLMGDGIDWIKSTTAPLDLSGNYTLEFKSPGSTPLAINSDWQNEEIRLVPITLKGVVDYLNSPAVSALHGNALASISSNGRKVQISSKTVGSAGSVEIQGGYANGASAMIKGSGKLTKDQNYITVTIPKADTRGFVGGQWVKIQNTEKLAKPIFTSATQATSITADGWITLQGTKAWDSFGYNDISKQWKVEKQGGFVCYSGYLPSDLPYIPWMELKEGSWVTIKGGGTFSPANMGTFRIVRSSPDAFWIVNEDAVEEMGVAGDVLFLARNSILPGNTLKISTTKLGSGNVGDWIVEAIDPNNEYRFKLNTSDKLLQPVAGTGPWGADSAFVQCVESEPCTLYEKIWSIYPNANASYMDVKFDGTGTDSACVQSIGGAAGSVMIALDKLAFPPGMISGSDGYRHNTGLLKEANKVVYGVERDPARYPGIAAAGANINLSGSVVKRIQVSLAIRIMSGVKSSTIIEKVKNAVAAEINKTRAGSPIALSNILAAASIQGVVAVTMISPELKTGSDIISIQSYEKPQVLDIDKDVTVTLVGD